MCAGVENAACSTAGRGKGDREFKLAFQQEMSKEQELGMDGSFGEA